jgi:hypothetical protein
MTLEPPTQQRTSPRAALDSTKSLKHRRADILVTAFQAAMVERWGAFKARRNHTLIDLVDALSRHGDFAEGGRVAYPIAKLARRFRKHARTVEDAVAKLRQFPALVSVVRVERGEPDWRGRRSFVTHLEWELGPTLRETLQQIESSPPGVTAANPRPHAGGSPGVTAPDLSSDLPTHLELKLKSDCTAPRTDRRNLAVDLREANLPIQLATETRPPAPHSTDTAVQGVATTPTPPEATPLSPRASAARLSNVLRPPATALAPATAPRTVQTAAMTSPPLLERPALASRPEGPNSDFPVGELDGTIREHRRIAEGKGPFVPIDDDERALVAGAMSHLTWCRSAEERLEWCRRVSELAARDSRQSGHGRATLAYTFGGLDDRPHKYFDQRSAILRERDELATKQHTDGELAAALLGTPRPPAKALPTVRLALPRRPWAAPTQPAPSGPPLSPAELLMSIADFNARNNPARVVRAG